MKRSDYMLAALASAVLPNLGVAGVRENVQASATDEAKGIDQTVIQDASGKLYDVYATDTKEGRTRLIRRVKAFAWKCKYSMAESKDYRMDSSVITLYVEMDRC